MTKLIIFATLKEAEHTIKALQCKKTDKKNLYQFEKGFLLITGIGLLAACHGVSMYHTLAGEILNFGIAASLQINTQIKERFNILSVSKYLPMHTEHEHSIQFAHTLFPKIELQTQGKRLISSYHPIHDEKLKIQLSHEADLVDMEGYAIAFSAKQVSKPCTLYKVISDFGEPQGPELINKHLGECSEVIADWVIEEVL